MSNPAPLPILPTARLAVGVIAALAWCVGAAASDPPTLSVEDAVKIGLKQNPQVAAGTAGVASAYANYRSVGAFPPVTLGASHVQGTSSAPTLNGTTNDTFVDIGETLDLSGQHRYQAAGANAQFGAAKFNFMETILTLEQQIRDAYWSLAAAQAQRRVAEASLADAQRVYELTVKQEKAGASPHGDVIRSSIDVANAKQTLLAAEGQERTSLLSFNTLLARRPTEPAKLSVDLSETRAGPMPKLPGLAELTGRAVKSRPLLKAAEAQAQSAKYAERQAEAARFPDIGVDYQRSVQTTYDTVVITANFPLFDFGSVTQAVKAARESRKQAEALRAQAKQQVVQQVAQAYADLELAMKAAAGYKQEILDPSITLLGMARLGYAQGATGILPVIDAESTIRNARVGYINSLAAVYKAEDEYFAATGALPMNAAD